MTICAIPGQIRETFISGVATKAESAGVGGSVNDSPKGKSSSRVESEPEATGTGGRQSAGTDEDASRRVAFKVGGNASWTCAWASLRKKALRNFLSTLRVRLGELWGRW